MITPEILRSLPLADEILESHRQRAHGDEAGYDAYKAHVYRVVNFARALCRRVIPFDLMHGDHIVSWSAGGTTTFDNLQALCGSCNLRKGAGSQEVIAARFDPAKLRPGMGELRRWQQLALPIVMDAIREEPVLVGACPGAGKTRFGLKFLSGFGWLGLEPIRLVFVVFGVVGLLVFVG